MYSNGGIYIPGRKPPMGAVRNPYLKINRGIVGDWMMWENGGPTVEDLSGNGNTGTFVNNPVWDSGFYGHTIDFERNNSQEIVIGDSDLLSFVGDLPFSIVVSITPESTFTGGIVSKASAIGTGEYYLFGVSDDLYFRCIQNSNGAYIGIRLINGLPLGIRRHIVGTYDGSGSSTGMKLYIDGVLASTIDASAGVYGGMENTAEPLHIGRRGTYYDGTFDFAHIYNRALSPSEVALLHQEPFCGFRWASIEQLMAYYEAVVAVGGIMTTNTGYWGAL